jgi:acyl-CoA synthetase (AMP-forming)/AMP-acid ligase II
VRGVRKIEAQRTGTPRPATARLLADAFGLEGAERDMIVSGAENVYPGLAAAILTSPPDVADVLLEPVADDEFGHLLRAIVEVRPGRALTADQLREWLDPRLSRAERPREITVVAALRRTATGKPVRDREP